MEGVGRVEEKRRNLKGFGGGRTREMGRGEILELVGEKVLDLDGRCAGLDRERVEMRGEEGAGGSKSASSAAVTRTTAFGKLIPEHKK